MTDPTTGETVTVSRAEWQAMLSRIEDLTDQLAIMRSDERRATLGEAEYHRLCYTDEEARRIALDDVSPIAIWRGRLGMTQRALAVAALISPSYLAEIEAGKKTGSVSALSRVAKVLRVPMEHLMVLKPT